MKVDPHILRTIPNYTQEEPPVFFGHYCLPAQAPKAPLAPNTACLDFSAGLKGPLVACRWNGEGNLHHCNLVTATTH